MKNTRLSRRQIELLALLTRKQLNGSLKPSEEETLRRGVTDLEQALHWLQEHGG